MARYPKTTGFHPKLVERIGDGIARVHVGISTRLWVTAVVRKQNLCSLCNNTINRGDRSWRELTQVTIHKLKRVCTRCWPREAVTMAMSADLRKKKPANRWGCKPNEKMCVEHNEWLLCKHGCSKCTSHECSEKAARMKESTGAVAPVQ